MLIKTSPAAGLTTEDLIIATAFLGLVADRIHDNGHEKPESIKAEFKACERELAERLRADKERKLKILESRMESLKSVPEKRKGIAREIAQLRRELGAR